MSEVGNKAKPWFNSQPLPAFRDYDSKLTHNKLNLVLDLISVLHIKGVDDTIAVASLTDEAFLGTQQAMSDMLLPHLDSLRQSVIECTTVDLY